jgi:hypothetical protein
MVYTLRKVFRKQESLDFRNSETLLIHQTDSQSQSSFINDIQRSVVRRTSLAPNLAIDSESWIVRTQRRNQPGREARVAIPRCVVLHPEFQPFAATL